MNADGEYIQLTILYFDGTKMVLQEFENHGFQSFNFKTPVEFVGIAEEGI